MKNLMKKSFVLPLLVVIAVALIVIKIKSKSPLEHQQQGYPSKIVEVISVNKIPFRARAVAYGYVEPSVVLKAKSEVKGKITYIHPNLKKGGSIAQGTVVIRIEPTTFEFSLNQSKAALSGNQSSLQQLEVEEKTSKRSLIISKKNLEVGKKELSRLLSIWKKGLIGRADVDKEEQKVLQLEQQVEDLKGKISAYQSKKSATNAQINQSKTQLAQSQDTLGRTEIVLPFDARIGVVSVDEGEFVAAGNVLFEALGTQSIEINAQLATSHFRPLLLSMSRQAIDLHSPKTLQATLQTMGLEAKISLVGYEQYNEKWEGKLLRLSESIDPKRDTIGVVIEVVNPYEGVIPGKRPPLLRGMYTAIDLLAPASEQFVLPRHAIHQGRVYIANNDNKLIIRDVNVVHQQGELVVVNKGVKVGDKVIVTDVIPVIDGLPIKIIESKELEQRILNLSQSLGYQKEIAEDLK